MHIRDICRAQTSGVELLRKVRTGSRHRHRACDGQVSVIVLNPTFVCSISDCKDIFG